MFVGVLEGNSKVMVSSVIGSISLSGPLPPLKQEQLFCQLSEKHTVIHISKIQPVSLASSVQLLMESWGRIKKVEHFTYLARQPTDDSSSGKMNIELSQDSIEEPPEV